MQVIEKLVLGKSNDSTICEDGIIVTQNMIAVIDGVTSKTNNLYNGKKGGRFCKDYISEFIENKANENLSALGFFLEISEMLYQEMKSNFSGAKPIEWPRASIIVFNSIKNEIWSYGDCQCVINGKNYTNTKKIDILLSELRSFYIELELLNHSSLQELQNADVGREKILSLLKEQVFFENNTESQFGYPVINGQVVNESMIKIYKVEPGDEVVLATDGYPLLRPTLKESEEELGNIINEDPICFKKFKSTKGVLKGNISYDDRAYCRFTV